MHSIILISPEKRIEAQPNQTVISNIDEQKIGNHQIYMPSHSIEQATRFKNAKIYMDLESYPFYQQVKNIIQKSETKKGVLRYWRMCKEDINLSLLIEDIFVISSLFGDPEKIHLEHTGKAVQPYHIILTVHFSTGALAHIEYTLCEKEEIQIEWNSIQKMVVFSSAEMNAYITNDTYPSSLVLSPELIFNHAHDLNDKLIEKLQKYKNYIQEAI